jgi:hypothetical protein
VTGIEQDLERVRAASGEELNGFIYHPAPAVLKALLDNPALDETKLALLLARKDLPGEVLEEIGTRKTLLKSYGVKKALLFHPRTPRLVGLRLIKDLYLMDIVQFTLSPAAPAELKRYAEEQVLARMPQLPLGQKITLARRGPGRVAGALVLEGHAQVMPIALDNPYLTEAQVLKALARDKVPTVVVQALARHNKWSHAYNVRLAIVRNPSAPISTVLAFLPELTVSDLRELAAPGIVSENLRKYLLAEVNRRMLASKKRAAHEVQGSLNALTPEPQDQESADEEERGGEGKSGAHGDNGPEETDD